eukprot:gene35399-29106_t
MKLEELPNAGSGVRLKERKPSGLAPSGSCPANISQLTRGHGERTS